uniref:Uncharacterized protein n=1 Tax=Panagrolaimus sp. ES5 TaxID=591445 RepID=A0AC34FYQ5_9BILA
MPRGNRRQAVLAMARNGRWQNTYADQAMPGRTGFGYPPVMVNSALVEAVPNSFVATHRKYPALRISTSSIVSR